MEASSEEIKLRGDLGQRSSAVQSSMEAGVGWTLHRTRTTSPPRRNRPGKALHEDPGPQSGGLAPAQAVLLLAGDREKGVGQRDTGRLRSEWLMMLWSLVLAGSREMLYRREVFRMATLVMQEACRKGRFQGRCPEVN